MIEAPRQSEIVERYPQIKKIFEYFVEEGGSHSDSAIQMETRRQFYHEYYRYASFWKESHGLEILPAKDSLRIARELIEEVANLSEGNSVNKEAAKAALRGDGYNANLLFKSDYSGFRGSENGREILFQLIGVADLVAVTQKDTVWRSDSQLKVGVDNLARAIPYRSYQEKQLNS